MGKWTGGRSSAKIKFFHRIRKLYQFGNFEFHNRVWRELSWVSIYYMGTYFTYTTIVGRVLKPWAHVRTTEYNRQLENDNKNMPLLLTTGFNGWQMAAKICRFYWPCIFVERNYFFDFRFISKIQTKLSCVCIFGCNRTFSPPPPKMHSCTKKVPVRVLNFILYETHSFFCLIDYRLKTMENTSKKSLLCARTTIYWELKVNFVLTCHRPRTKNV